MKSQSHILKYRWMGSKGSRSVMLTVRLLLVFEVGGHLHFSKPANGATSFYLPLWWCTELYDWKAFLSCVTVGMLWKGLLVLETEWVQPPCRLLVVKLDVPLKQKIEPKGKYDVWSSWFGRTWQGKLAMRVFTSFAVLSCRSNIRIRQEFWPHRHCYS